MSKSPVTVSERKIKKVSPPMHQVYPSWTPDFFNLMGVEMKKHVSCHHRGPISGIIGRTMSKYRFPDLSLSNLLGDPFTFGHVLFPLSKRRGVVGEENEILLTLPTCFSILDFT
jgi:hypothetical protein